jgi:HSP20 family molecular chaperone IbpA
MFSINPIKNTTDWLSSKFESSFFNFDSFFNMGSANDNHATSETDTTFKVEIVLPKVTKDEIIVELVGNSLNIKVNNKSSNFNYDKDYSFILGPDVNTESAKANLSDGVLTISFNKSKVDKPKRRIDID